MTCAGPHRVRFSTAALVALLATAVFTAWLHLGVGGDSVTLYVDDLGTLLAAVTAAGLCVGAGLAARGRLRLFWLLLACAAGSWAVAEGIWGAFELFLVDEVPVPSWADVGYLAGIPLAVAALLCHPAMRGTGIRKARAVLDGLALAAALLFLSWTVVLGPLWRATDLTTLGGAVALAYPFGDVVIVFFILLVIRGITPRYRLALWCLLGGLLLMALTDSVYAYLTGVKSYETGSVIDAGWFASYLAIALGAFSARARSDSAVPVRAEARLSSEGPALLPLVAPFVPMLVALTVAGINIQLGHRLDRAGWTMAFALVGIVLIRQALLVLELLAPPGGRQAGLVERMEVVALGVGVVREARAGHRAAAEAPVPRPDHG